MEAKLVMVVLQGRVKLVRSMNPAAIDDHHDLFASFAEGGHHLMDILAQLLGIKMRHDFIEDFRGAILDGADDTEQHAAGDATPRAVLPPRLPFEDFLRCLIWPWLSGRVGRRYRWARAPPAQPGQGKAPHDRFVFIEQDDLTSTCPVLQGGEFERAIGESSRGGFEPSSGTAGA